MNVVLIGSGNVATVLGKKICSAAHQVIQVISKNAEHAEHLARQLNAGFSSGFASVSQSADIYIAAISDNSLLEMEKHLFLDKKLIVHTAGSVSKNVLRKVSSNYGVLYPLQSLRRENENIPEMPLLIDANTNDNIALIDDFARTISGNVKVANDEARMKLHVGAIIVNNFSNQLYSLTDDYCKKENVDFKWLLPLINETASRLQYFSPAEMQTGPAARKDMKTIEKHLAMLEKHAALKNLYELFTESILASAPS